LSAAIEGRRLARLTLDSQPELRTEPAEQRDQADNKTEDTHVDLQPRYPAERRGTGSGSQAGAEAESGRPENAAEGEPS
jgi:hypothetical protein